MSYITVQGRVHGMVGATVSSAMKSNASTPYATMTVRNRVADLSARPLTGRATNNGEHTMKTYKDISYSYPGSPNAEQLGFGKTGCWHISQTYVDIEGSGQCRTFLPHDAEGFAEPTDPDLISLFGEYEGEPDPSFLKYGNEAALRAIGLR